MKRICSNKEVLLGVTGSIAAYKACEIASRLVKMGLRVTPALTESATRLVGPATFEALTSCTAITGMWEPVQTREVGHISVSQRVALFLIAPATANILAKAAHGIADDWLSTALLATRAPVLFAPAMNTSMYEHPATQANIETLVQRGCRFVKPETGRMACGTEGVGRMAPPEAVVEAACLLLSDRQDFTGMHVLITCGRNHEPIDPVRFIANRSSGKMGRALAFEALARGARVSIVTGPTDVSMPRQAEVIRVETARLMAEAVTQRAGDADVIVAAAAVADYRVAEVSQHKHKRDGAGLQLNLVANPDILADIARNRREGQILVGFAAETDNLVGNAQTKLSKKGLDLIVANRVGAGPVGFGADDLEAVILGAGDADPQPARVSKEDLATNLFDRIAHLVPQPPSIQ